jgi:DNA-binding beta-propeller fold protein YncE
MRRTNTLFIVFVAVALVAPTLGLAATGDVSTYLGRISAGDGGPAISAQLDRPRGIAVLKDGTIFVADSENQVVRKIRGADSVASTYAGFGGIGIRDGVTRSATFFEPADVAVMGKRVYVADSGNGRVRYIADGSVYTIRTDLNHPEGIKVTGTSLYVADTGNDRIVVMNPNTGRILRSYSFVKPTKFIKVGPTIYAVTHGGTTITALNLVTSARRVVKTGLHDAGGIADVNGNVVFSDGANGIYNTLFKYTPSTRVITRIANRRLETEWYNFISDLEFVNGTLYASMSRGSSIFTMNPDGSSPVRIAGEHRYGDRDGTAGELLFGRPKDVALSPDGGTMYVLENNKIKAFDLATRTLRLLAGHANDNYVEGTSGIAGRMSGTNQIVVSPDGERVYFADRNNNRIRFVTVATGTTGYLTGAGGKNGDALTRNGYREGSSCPDQFALGVAGCAYFNRPNGIAISPDGSTLYVADTQNNRIRTVNVATGATTLLAGSGAQGLTDGIRTGAKFRTPWAIELSADGTTLYVADRDNHAIRAVTVATGRVTTLTGNGLAGYRNGAFADARLNLPEYVALGPDANTLFVSEAGTNRIRKLRLNTRQVSLFAGSGRKGSTNGAATLARFYGPKGMTVLGSKLLVTDQLNDLIRGVQL